MGKNATTETAVKPDVKPEVKAEVKPDVKPEVKPTDIKKETRKKKNKKHKKNKDKVNMTDEEKAELEKQAIAEVNKHIAAPDPDKNFCPDKWKGRYAGALGNYKQWLKSKSDLFVVIDVERQNFVIRKVGAPDIEELKMKAKENKGWSEHLNNAWSVYVKQVPVEKQDFEDFISVMSEQVRATSPGMEPVSRKRKAEPEKLVNEPKEEPQSAVKAEDESKPASQPKKKKKVKA